MKPLDYWSEQAARAATTPRQPSSSGLAEFFGDLALEVLGGLIEFAINALFSGF